MVKLKPLYDRIVVKRVDAARNPESRIIMPDVAMEKPQEGEVIAVGPGRDFQLDHVSLETQRFEMPVKVGDRVLFGKYNGTEVEIGGEKLLIMRADDIFAVIETDTAGELVEVRHDDFPISFDQINRRKKR